MPRSRYRRKRKNATAMVANAVDLSGLGETVVPGFAGYAATRFLSRVAYQSSPKAKKHVAVGAAVAATGVLLLFGDKIKQIAKWQEPLLVGAGIAAAQSVAQTYLPKYGWIVGDYAEGPNASTQKKEVPAPEAASDFELEQMLAENDLEEVPLGLPEGPSEPAPSAQEDDFSDVYTDLGDYNENHDSSLLQ